MIPIPKIFKATTPTPLKNEIFLGQNGTLMVGILPDLIVWQSSHQSNWTRQNFSPTKELIPIYLLKEP